jgi:hypothetical protein
MCKPRTWRAETEDRPISFHFCPVVGGCAEVSELNLYGNHHPRRIVEQSDAIMETKSMRSAKVWAYRESSGRKYFEVVLDDRTRARIEFLDGSTTQQSFLALAGALDLTLGTCCITPMNKLALFDESDGLFEAKKREFLNTLYSPLKNMEAWEQLTRRPAETRDQIRAQEVVQATFVGSAIVKSQIARAITEVLGEIAHRTGFGHGPSLTQRSIGAHQGQQKLMEAMFRFIGVTRQYAGMIRLKAPIWASQINSNITPAMMAVRRKIAHLMAAIAGPIFEHGPLFSQSLTGVVEMGRQRLTRQRERRLLARRSQFQPSSLM